mmetsp:Transcript_29732/g.33146  ORF Transcript_29732/g.33146 Transcript_29732/m.33146 type:complete len:629 (-) Transcript_29732:142-2028(-)
MADTLRKRKRTKEEKTNDEEPSSTTSDDTDDTSVKASDSQIKTLEKRIQDARRVFERQLTKIREEHEQKIYVAIIAGIALTLAVLGALAVIYAPDTIKEGWDPLLNDTVAYVNGTAEILSSYWKNATQPFVSRTVKDRPGETLSKAGYGVHHPVIMIPGLVTSHLELWKANDDWPGFFRQRLWGSIDMVQCLLRNPALWVKYMQLNTTTGLDPDGIKLRAVEGFSGADYLLPSYWVFAKLIQNLGDLGYDSSTMHMASYDWRLATPLLEKRDNYFSRLKSTIQELVKFREKKVVVYAHSMGTNVFYYFLNWVKHRDPTWVDKHVDSFIPIGGPFLGVSKAVSTYLSAQMRETSQFAAVMPIINQIVTHKDRLQIFRSFYSGGSMLPKGGNLVWGDESGAPDDLEGFSVKHFLKFDEDGTAKNLTLDESLEFLWDQLGSPYAELLQNWYSLGVAKNLSDPKYDNEKYWTNPLESSLPNAPNFKIFCLYGVGQDSERGAWYTKAASNSSATEYVVNASKNNKECNISYGMQIGEGDHTVPLLSLGYMCVKGWNIKRYNPHGVKVITREFEHKPEWGTSRGGGSSADHVDLLGNDDFLTHALKIASGRIDDISDNRIFSKIEEYSEKVKLS